MEENTRIAPRKPSLGVALIPVLFLIAILVVGILVYRQDAHVLLAIAACFAGVIGKRLGYTWKEMEDQIFTSLTLSMRACFILITVGVLIAVWILGGVVPAMIYYGLLLIHPAVFLATTLLVCSVVSLTIGSSWSTVATVGIAFMGIGIALGVPPEMTAGTAISGAYFGDKMSPLSDTTNLASAATGVELFAHIRHMLYTTVPAYIISLGLLIFMGIRFAGGDYAGDQVEEIMTAIREAYHINPVMLLPVLFVILMIAKKIPPLPGLWLGIFMGVIFMFIFQLRNYDSAHEAMGTLLTATNWGVSSDTGHAVIDRLFSGGGLQSMLYSVSVVFCSMAFAGIVEKIRSLEVITENLLTLAKSIKSLVIVSVFSAFLTNVMTADQYLSIILPGRMFRGSFEKKGYATKNFARALEDGGTMTSALVPWNACALFMSGTLGVATLAYLPFTFFNIFCFVISIIVGITGLSLVKLTPEEMAQIESDQAVAEASLNA
jgi:NhaC family Na+:H+ antiporter